jgi:hypothetical protein
MLSGIYFSATRLTYVCSAMELAFWLLTPSIISIPPDEGQLGPKVQTSKVSFHLIQFGPESYKQAMFHRFLLAYA